jgi:hypothetical protein
MPAIQRYEIHRGRTSELERTGTGTATITMVDTNGSLDPSGVSTYAPSAPVAIALHNPVTNTDHQIYGGKISRWTYDLYETERYGIATLECVDGMAVLANTMLKAEVHGDPSAVAYYDGNVKYDRDGEVKHRIDHALTDAGWPLGMREVFTGNCRIKPTTYAPGNPILNVITDAADAEFPGVANFYFSKTNWATFHGRLARFNPTEPTYHITTWEAGDTAAVAADPGRAPIYALDYDEDDARVINSAFCTPEGIKQKDIAGQYVEDAGSIGTFGTRAWSAENLIVEHGWLTGNNAKDEARLYAEYYTTNFSDTAVRVNRVQFKTVHPSHPWAASVWALMCGIDISDRIQLTTTHHGGAAGFNDYYYVEGLHYTVEPLAADYMWVTLDVDLSPAAWWDTLPS